MVDGIGANRYLEYGVHEGSYYGIRIDTIQKIHEEGKMAVIDVEPQV